MSDKMRRATVRAANADTEDWWGDFDMDVPPPPLSKYKEQTMRKSKKKHGMSTASRLLALLTGIVAVTCLFVQIYRISVITAQNKEIYALTKELKELESTMENLEVRIGLQLDPERIEDEAENRLGMFYPEDDQVRRIAIGNTNAGVMTANAAPEEGGQ